MNLVTADTVKCEQSTSCCNRVQIISCSMLRRTLPVIVFQAFHRIASTFIAELAIVRACGKIFLKESAVDLRGCAGGHVILLSAKIGDRGSVIGGLWPGCFRGCHAGVQERFKGVGGEA